MSETVIVGLINSVTALLTLGLVPILLSTRRHAKEAVYQVKNSHKTNLRDELDARDEKYHRRFDRIERHLGIEPEQEDSHD